MITRRGVLLAGGIGLLVAHPLSRGQFATTIRRVGMLFLASDEKGWLKLGGEMIQFSADRSSTELPYLSWSKYVGLARSVQMERDTAAARSTGPEIETAPGTVTIRDERDRVVFKRSGAIDCGA